MSSSDGIQFDTAEFAADAPQSACGECATALAGYYYDVNGRTLCERCRYAVEARFNGGSRLGRFARATGLGSLAAAIGFGIYYGISALTGYEFGLIAIVVGFMVGVAVRIGSNGRGGWAYQTLAMMLTYLAIVSTYIPPLIQGIREARTQEEAQVLQAAETTPAAAQTAGATPATPATPADATRDRFMQLPRAVRWAIGIALIVGIACAAPFLVGFQNIVGIVIIGIGLYEAWKINRRTELTITGPHIIKASAAPAGA